MSRNILAIVAMLLCSAGSLAQESFVPQNNNLNAPGVSGFQPPSKSLYAPPSARPEPVFQEPETTGEPETDEVPLIIPPQSNQATIQPVKGLRPVPVLEPIQSDSGFTPAAETTLTQEANPQPPMPEPKAQEPQRTPLDSNASNQFNTELPAPRREWDTFQEVDSALRNDSARTEGIQLREDTQTYGSVQPQEAGVNRYGISDYRLEVARERARARRLRMEVKKWYGVDTARPVVKPHVDISVYSAYYNGVYSRHGNHYHNPYNLHSSFYYHVPVAR